MAQTGRVPLTRQVKLIPLLKGAVFVQQNAVGEQLVQLKKALSLETCPTRWFTRCIRCNVKLMAASEKLTRDNVPEHVFYENMKTIQFCPAGRRCFWRGSHRIRMEKQLKEWGFINPFLDLVSKS